MTENVARVRLNMWLGLYEESENIFKNLNDGYGIKFNELNLIGLPSQLFYFGL